MRSFPSGRGVAAALTGQQTLARRRRKGRACLERAVIEVLEERRMLSLSNPGFESPDVGAGNYEQNPSQAVWTFAGDSGIAANGAEVLNGVSVPEGSQAARLANYGYMDQSFNVDNAFAYYVQFQAASLSGSSESFEVNVGGESLGSFGVSSGPPSTQSGGPVVLNQDTYSIHFGSPSGPVLIDNVQLIPVTFSAPGLDSSDYGQNHAVTVSWSEFPGADGYEVERAADGSSFSDIGSGNNFSLTDNNLYPGVTYSYRIDAHTSFGTVSSDVSSFTTPSAGGAPVLTAVWAHEVDIVVPQDDPPHPFRLLRSEDGQNYSDLWINGTNTFATSEVHDTTVLPERTYYYRVETLENFSDAGGVVGDASAVTTPEELLIHLGAAQTRVTQGGRSFVLDLDAAGNPSGSDVVGWDITWGDGTAIQHVNGNPHSVPHTYTAPGSYHVSAVLDWQTYHYPVYGLSFDTSFGGGMVRSSFGSNTGDSANAVATLPEGRLLVAGNSGGSFALAQFLADGTPDPDFGDHGLVITSFGSSYTARGAAVTVAGGKYLVAGDVHSAGSGYDFALARYNADGTLDDSFGNGGTVITSFTSDARANAVAVQANGDIIVAGFTHGDFAIAHYHSDGSLDAAWGSGTGKLILNFGSASEIAYGIGIAPDGKVVVTGRNNQHILTIRLLATGTLDSSFGTGGAAVSDIGWGGYSYAVAFAAGGKVILAGESMAQFTVVRLNADGSLDHTLAGVGYARIGALGTAYARTVMVQSDGNIVAGGGGEGYYDIVRLKPDGTLDTSFADGGLDRTFDGAPDGGYFSALGAYPLDGRLLAMGGVDTSFLMARYVPQNSVIVLSADALGDGSFETPVVSGGWITKVAGSTIGPWTVQSGSVDLIGNYWQAAEGLQSLDMSGGGAGVIYQDVQTVPGQTYTLRFAMAGNLDAGSTVKALQVTWDLATAANPAVVATPTFSTTGHSHSDMGWAHHEYTLTALGTVMRLRFVSLEYSEWGAALDDVSLTPANAIANGSFETATNGVPASWNADASSVISDGIAADGDRYARLGDEEASGSVTQDVPTYNGQKYRLSFSLGALEGSGVGAEVWWNGEQLDSPTPAGDALPGSGILDWSDFAYVVTATSALSALKFESSSAGVFGAAYLDNVQLVPLVKPPAPSNLRARAASATRIDLHWQDNSEDETGFVIKSSTDGSNFIEAGRAGAGAINYSLVGLTPNTDYWFEVVAVDDGSDTDTPAGGSGEDDALESDPSNVARSVTLVEDLDVGSLDAKGTWRFNANGSAVSGQSALPTLDDGVGYRLTVSTVGASNSCSWSGCCGGGGLYGNPDYALVIEPANYCCWSGCCNHSAVYGDAEYAVSYDYGPDPDRLPITDADTMFHGTDVGLKISNGIRGATPFWGDYNWGHTYTRDVVGNGHALVASYVDSFLDDNTGAVQVFVQKIVSTDVPLPSPTISGATTWTEGQTQDYALTIDSHLAAGVDAWSVDWGDGNVQSVSGTPQSQVIGHRYTDGAPSPVIVATATNAAGSVDSNALAIQIIPDHPTDLLATPITDSQVRLAWANHSGVATGYSIDRSDDGGTTWNEIGSAGGDATSFEDSELDEGTQYRYRVHATTGDRNSAYSNVSPVTTLPAAATNLVAAATSPTTVQLTWDDNSAHESGYHVKKFVEDGTSCTTYDLPVDASADEFTNLEPLTTYRFKVYSYNAAGEADYAAESTVTMPADGDLPDPVDDLGVSISSGLVTLNWGARTDVTHYDVLRSDDGGPWQRVSAPEGLSGEAASFSDYSASADGSYTYRLIAYNDHGPSTPSNLVTATPTGLAPPIDVTAEPDANGHVVLKRTDRTRHETSFKIWRYETVSGQQVRTLEAEAAPKDGIGQVVSFIVADVTPGHTYHFGVAAATADTASTEGLSDDVTPAVRSVSLSGASSVTFGSSYTLTLKHTASISSALNWHIDWGDGVESPLTQSAGNSDATISHTYTNAVAGKTEQFAIHAWATAGGETYVAGDWGVTGTAAATGSTADRAKRAVLDEFEAVYNTIKYEPYFGLRKSPDAAEAVGAANDWDQAALLKRNIEKHGLPQRYGFSVVFVAGYVESPSRDVMRWLGVTDLSSLELAFSAAGIQWSVEAGDKIRFLHAWLRLKSISLGWSNSEGDGGVDLDPSWKYRELRANRVSAGDAVVFNVADFRNQADESPLEWYESQVRNYLKGRSDVSGSTSLADLAYQGPILAKQFINFPSLADGAFVISDDVSEFDDPRYVANISGVTGNANFAHRLRVTVGTSGRTWIVDVAKYGAHPIVIQYEAGTSAGKIKPVLHAQSDDGTEEVLTPESPTLGYEVTAGQAIKVTIQAILPDSLAQRTDVDPYRRARTFDRIAGDPLAVMVEAQQVSKARLQEVQADLNTLAVQTADPDLAEYQLKLLGLIALQYAENSADRTSAVCAITGVIPVSMATGFGLITGVRDPDNQDNALEQRRATLPNPFVFYDAFEHKGIFVDLPGQQVSNIAITDRNRQQGEDSSWNAIQYIDSELESAVLEDGLNTEAVSTVKGFQVAAQRDHAKFLHFIAGNTTSDAATSDIVRSVNQLFAGHNDQPAIDFREQLSKEIMGDTSQGIAPSDVWIADDVVTFNTNVASDPFWRGFVWFTSRSDGSAINANAMIQEYGKGQPSSGAYQVSSDPLVTASESYESSQVNSAPSLGDPVNLFTGALYDDETDISLPNVAFPATFSRHYDSSTVVLNSNDTGVDLTNDADRGFGLGWMFGYGDFIKSGGHGTLTWHTSQGQRYEFTLPDGASTYTDPSGLFGTATAVKYAPTQYAFQYKEKDGTTYLFASRDPDQKGLGRLLSVQDRNGNRIDLDYYHEMADGTPLLSTVTFVPALETASAHRRVLFTFDKPADDHYTTRQVQDYAGRTWIYQFTYRNNERYLTSVVSPSVTDDPNPDKAVESLQTRYDYYPTGDRRDGLLESISRDVAGANRGTQFYDYYANRRAFSTTDATNTKGVSNVANVTDPHTEYFSYDLFTSKALNANNTPVYTHAAYHTDTSGHTTKVEFNLDGLITRTINPDRSRIEETWQNDPRDAKTPKGRFLLNTTTNEIGLTDSYQYDNSRGNVISHLTNSWDFLPATGGHGIYNSFTYDKNFNGVTSSTIYGFKPGSKTHWDERTTTNTYDNHGNLKTVNLPVTDGVTHLTFMHYDANGMMDYKILPLGNVPNAPAATPYDHKVRYTYDPLGSGQVSTETRRLDHSAWADDVHGYTVVSSTTYDPQGNPETVTDGTSRVVKYVFDKLNRKRVVTVDASDPEAPGETHLDLSTRYTYADDELTRVVDPADNGSYTIFDEMGRPVESIDRQSQAHTQYLYDQGGNLASASDPLGHVTQYLYDDRNRPIQTLYADGGFSRVLLDGAGRTVAASEPLNNVSGYALDPVAQTTTTYNSQGFVESVIDPVHQETHFDYNSLGEEISSSFYSNYHDQMPFTKTVLVRDALGRVTESRSDSQVVTKTTFDADGNAITNSRFDVSRKARLGVNFLDINKVKLDLPSPSAHTTTTDYDAADRAIAVTDPMGHITRTEYDAAGRVTAVIDPRGAVPVGQTDPHPDDYKTQYDYDAAGRLQKTTLPIVTDQATGGADDTITYEHDGSGRVTKVTNARTKAITTFYDDRDRTVTVEDALHHQSKQTFDVAGNLTKSTDPRNHDTDFEYDARNRLVKTSLPADANNVRLVTLNTYDQAGNLVQVDQGQQLPNNGPVKGLRTNNTFDALHRNLKTQLSDTTASPASPVFISLSQSVYLKNNLSQSIDGLGYHTQYDYDKANRVTAVLAGHIANSKPSRGAPAAADIVSASTYDGFGNLASQTQYPDHANINTARTTTYTYDADDRLKTVTDPDPDGRPNRGYSGLLTTYDYDQAGNLQTVTDPEGTSTSLYDARNRVYKEIAPDPDGVGSGPEHAKQPGVTDYLFDADGNVTRMTDPANNVTDYKYDDLDRLQSQTNHVFLKLGQEDVSVNRGYEYDENGNLKSSKDRDDRWRSFTYDARDQLTDENWLSGKPGESGTTTQKQIHFTYDTLGRQTSANSDYLAHPGNRDYRLTFNGAGQVKVYEQGVHDTGGFSDMMLLQTFDARGQLFQQNALIGQSNDFANTYSYTPDALANPKAIFQLAGGRAKRVVFGMNQIGDITSIDRQNNATLKKGGSGTPVPGAYRTYGYDKAGELTAIGKGGRSIEYAYTRDQKHRVTTIKQPGKDDQSFSYFFDDELKTAPGVGNTTQSFDYDANFNRTSGGSQTGKDNRLKEDTNYTYEYDNESNLIKRTAKVGGASIEFQYDFRNRLIGASFYNSGHTLLKSTGYTYDAADRLTRRAGGLGGTQRYVYDGTAGPSASDDVIFVFAGDTISPQTLLSRYTNGPGAHFVLAEDTPGLVQNARTHTFWHINDDKGSPRKVMDDGGNVISSLDFDAFGQMTGHTGPVPLVGFTGGMPDPDTGLVLMGERWDDTGTGRFTSQDPAFIGTNLYPYVGNNPMNYRDPSGMSGIGLGSGNHIADFGGGLSASQQGFADRFPTPDFANWREQLRMNLPQRNRRIELPDDYQYPAALPGEHQMLQLVPWRVQQLAEADYLAATVPSERLIHADESADRMTQIYTAHSYQADLDAATVSDYTPDADLGDLLYGVAAYVGSKLTFDLTNKMGLLPTAQVHRDVRAIRSIIDAVVPNPLELAGGIAVGQIAKAVSAARLGASAAAAESAELWGSARSGGSAAAGRATGSVDVFSSFPAEAKYYRIGVDRLPNGMLAGEGPSAALEGSEFIGGHLYEVDEYGKLAAMSTPGMERNHAIQRMFGVDLIPTYPSGAKAESAPAIRLLQSEHELVTAAQRGRIMVPDSARQALAWDIRDMRRFTQAPNSAYRALINMHFEKYEWDFKVRGNR